jgi:hypothetical protein
MLNNIKTILGALLLTGVMGLSACSGDKSAETAQAPETTPAGAVSLDEQVEEYLFLELSMGLHDPAQVDAWIGPERIGQKAEAEQLSLEDIAGRSGALSEWLAELPRAGMDELQRQRVRGLESRLQALQTRIRLKQGADIPFDEESLLLFDAVAPTYEASHFEDILGQIDALLPGDAPLPERVSTFREQFHIPPDRLADVFEAAIAECQRRTLQHLDLPEHERVTIEYVSGVSWGAYNWYKGDAHSLIQVNTDLPKTIDAAVDLGCHEGYPGHHAYNALVEHRLVEENVWLEYSLYPLFSPQSLIMEGTGNYGIEMAFPGNSRVEFEREQLFPLAGLDAGDADRYYRFLELRAQLNYAGNEAARNYLDGTFDSEQARQWLVDYNLDTPEEAEKKISFYDGYRSYVINYNYGKDLVAAWIEADGADSEERWKRFTRLLSYPMSPSDIR